MLALGGRRGSPLRAPPDRIYSSGMKLHSTSYGTGGPPLVILHGLFGSSRNWATVGEELASHARVFTLDLRNHGQSPHAPSHTLDDLVGDLREWRAEHLEESPVLLGHSMGGIVSMGYALRWPEDVRAVVIVDIAPVVYPWRHECELEALKLDLAPYTRRREIDEALKRIVPDARVRHFLQTNIERDAHGFRWRIDAATLERSTVSADVARLEGQYSGPALFVSGARSPYLEPSTHQTVRRFFPRARIEVLAQVGHWLHVQAPSQFVALVRAFLSELPAPA